LELGFFNSKLPITNYKSTMKLRTQKLRGTEATEIAEAALVMPVVFIFLLGIIWFGRAFNIYSTITQAAQQGAIVAARPSCATCGATGGWSGTDFPGDTAVSDAISSVLTASSLNPAQIPPNMQTPPSAFCTLPAPTPAGACSPAVTTGNITICREVWLNSPGQPQICGTVVSFQYPVPFYVPFTSLTAGSFKVGAQAQSRMEN
jgi:hypothetical protein